MIIGNDPENFDVKTVTYFDLIIVEIDEYVMQKEIVLLWQGIIGLLQVAMGVSEI